MKFRSGKRTQFNLTNITKLTFAADVFFRGERDLEKRYILVKERKLRSHESIKGEIFSSSHAQIFLFFVKMDKIRKGSDLRKEK